MGNERDVLIQELKKSFRETSPWIYRDIADFILADRKATVEKIVGPLKDAKEEVEFNGCWEPENVPTHQSIDESLKLAEEVTR